MSEPSLGRVAAPPGHESTSTTFYFWVDRDRCVERTQLVTTTCQLGGRTVRFFGLVQEVYRLSRQKSMGEEAARFDSCSGDSGGRPPFDSEGVTYAEVTILRTDPVVHSPPTEECEVRLGGESAAEQGYGFDGMKQPLEVGRLRNGGDRLFAGPAKIDLAYLLGENGGHLNVNGIAGLGTKSTLLLTWNWLLLDRARREKASRPSDTRRLQVVSVIFNVKNYDLFHIDRPNKSFDRARHLDDWRAIGVETPGPFGRPEFYAPQRPRGTTAVATGSRLDEVKPYSWSLADVIEQGLFAYLFAEDDLTNANLGGLVSEVEEWLTEERGGEVHLNPAPGRPQTFDALLTLFRDKPAVKAQFPEFTPGTFGSFARRLRFILRSGDGVLRPDDTGRPIVVPPQGKDVPMVIDLFSLYRAPTLQRFVVAAVLHQIMRIQTEKQVPGLKFLITLDELNRFAPRGGRDPITRQIELVASEGRSQGVILFGAQQQASLVSAKVTENAAVKVIGRSGALELTTDVWRFLSPSARQMAANLQPDEKLISLPTFREVMLAKIPYPPFALSENDAAPAERLPGRRVSDSRAADEV